MVSQRFRLLRNVDEWWRDAWRRFSQQLFCILCSGRAYLTGSEVTPAIQDMWEHHSWMWMTGSHKWMDWKWQEPLRPSSRRGMGRPLPFFVYLFTMQEVHQGDKSLHAKVGANGPTQTTKSSFVLKYTKGRFAKIWRIKAIFPQSAEWLVRWEFGHLQFVYENVDGNVTFTYISFSKLNEISYTYGGCTVEALNRFFLTGADSTLTGGTVPSKPAERRWPTRTDKTSVSNQRRNAWLAQRLIDGSHEGRRPAGLQ